ncbi:RraA family protein [Ramlibacter sp.]|uniref:RraA family protein n=1 Tax=Ramlibacter sp. TaxID=1917967 RepID=UPI003D1018F7
MSEAIDPVLAELRGFDGYTLGDSARRAQTGGVLHAFKPQGRRTTFVGRALTARIQYEPHRSIPVKEYGGAQLREHAKPGDVIVLDAGGLMLSAMGELAFAHLVRRGAVGVVLNGCVRDVEQLETLDLDLAVFALGTAISTVAGNARIIDVGSTVYLNGIRIDSGDLVAGCRGGVIAAPWNDREAILEQARSIGESDRQVRDGMARGESMPELWSKHK